jgi:hypothetical protein
MVIAEVIHIALLGLIYICKKSEIESHTDQFLFMSFRFAVRVQIRKNLPVFSKYPVDTLYIVGRIAVQPVIIACTALIATEFFIYST